jgi:hypothetical protein
MKLRGFIINGTLLTAIALGYVHQHTEVYKAGYEVQGSRQRLSYLIDQNCNLMYDLSRLESPRYLLASLDGGEMEFSRHGKRRVTGYSIARSEVVPERHEDGIMGKFLDILIPKAEARTRSHRRQ